MPRTPKNLAAQELADAIVTWMEAREAPFMYPERHASEVAQALERYLDLWLSSKSAAELELLEV